MRRMATHEYTHAERAIGVPLSLFFFFSAKKTVSLCVTQTRSCGPSGATRCTQVRTDVILSNLFSSRPTVLQGAIGTQRFLTPRGRCGGDASGFDDATVGQSYPVGRRIQSVISVYLASCEPRHHVGRRTGICRKVAERKLWQGKVSAIIRLGVVDILSVVQKCREGCVCG